MTESARRLSPEQAALRRRVIAVTLGFAVVTIALVIGGVVTLTTSSHDVVDGVVALGGSPFAAFTVYVGVRLLRRGARTGDYSPPTRGLP